MRYASNTDVPVEKSRAEVERILVRYGASHFAYAMQPGLAMIAFEANGRRVRFELPLPDRNAKEFTQDKRSVWKTRSTEKAFAAWEQACRQKWRALALVVKAKLEAVDSKITTFEDEFLAHIVMPDGITVGDHIRGNIAAAYAGGNVPLLAPPSKG